MRPRSGRGQAPLAGGRVVAGSLRLLPEGAPPGITHDHDGMRSPLLLEPYPAILLLSLNNFLLLILIVLYTLHHRLTKTPGQ